MTLLGIAILVGVVVYASVRIECIQRGKYGIADHKKSITGLRIVFDHFRDVLATYRK